MISNFNIIRRKGVDPVSRTMDSVAERGCAYSQDPDDLKKAIKATDTGVFLGFGLQEVTEEGPGLREDIFMIGGSDTGLQNPVKAGYNVAIEDVQIAELEGEDLLTTKSSDASGIRITNTTAVGTEMTAHSGRIGLAQTGDTVLFRLIANSGLSGSTLKALNGGIRIQVQRVHGYKK